MLQHANWSQIVFVRFSQYIMQTCFNMRDVDKNDPLFEIKLFCIIYIYIRISG